MSMTALVTTPLGPTPPSVLESSPPFYRWRRRGPERLEADPGVGGWPWGGCGLGLGCNLWGRGLPVSLCR